MKNKTIIGILISGIILIIVGAIFKIMHWGFEANALINRNMILATGLVLNVVALLCYIIGFLRVNKK